MVLGGDTGELPSIKVATVAGPGDSVVTHQHQRLGQHQSLPQVNSLAPHGRHICHPRCQLRTEVLEHRAAAFRQKHAHSTDTDISASRHNSTAVSLLSIKPGLPNNKQTPPETTCTRLQKVHKSLFALSTPVTPSYGVPVKNTQLCPGQCDSVCWSTIPYTERLEATNQCFSFTLIIFCLSSSPSLSPFFIFFSL